MVSSVDLSLAYCDSVTQLLNIMSLPSETCFLKNFEKELIWVSILCYFSHEYINIFMEMVISALMLRYIIFRHQVNFDCFVGDKLYGDFTFYSLYNTQRTQLRTIQEFSYYDNTICSIIYCNGFFYCLIWETYLFSSSFIFYSYYTFVFVLSLSMSEDFSSLTT